MTQKARKATQTLDEYQYGFSSPDAYVEKFNKGLGEETIRAISAKKKEPAWMLEFRLKAYRIFLDLPMPDFGADLSELDFQDMHYYVRPTDKQGRSWADVPEEMKKTFDRLGVPQAEKAWLAGVGAQFDSEVIYHNIKEALSKQGVEFLDMDGGLREHPEMVQEYIGTLIPPTDNKFAALNSAVWSGGSFVYVPKGVKVTMPLQAYFRINARNMGQFERTLIVVDEDAEVHYVEGCTAPVYSASSLHAAVVEIFCKPRSNVRYTTIQNWSKDVYNLVTKRATVAEEARMSWVDGNLGSKVTMKYPAVILAGRKAHGEVLSIAFAGDGQHQDAGGRAIHLAPETTSTITSKSISKGTGRSSYRGTLRVTPRAPGSRSHVRCDAILLGPEARSDTYPKMKIHQNDVTIEHEASVSRIGAEQLFFLMSRGFTEEEAKAMIVNGFIRPIVKELPFEYAIELNRLIELEMEGSVG
ncbi:MAG: Fe-S cluster assembly protein SufB [Patescibacteria group bacterium]|jgi:Fe-S cluster assembly protein SufB